MEERKLEEANSCCLGRGSGEVGAAAFVGLLRGDIEATMCEYPWDV
jgi:hypothetical protein